MFKAFRIKIYFFHSNRLVMVMKGLKFYLTQGVVFVSVLGTLLHFAYNWSGNNLLVGLFTPINESIWEHAKLIFFPLLFYALYLDKRIGKDYPCINSAIRFASLFGVTLIIVLFYTYSGILGFHVAFVDISIFYISVILVFYLAYQLTNSCKAEPYGTILQILEFVLLCLFIFFTFFPPNLPLFINPK